MSPRPRRWQSQALWTPLTPYESMEAVAGLASLNESYAAYARRKGVHQSAVSQAVERENPDLHARMIEKFGGTAIKNKKTGASFESAVRGALKTRGYYCIKSYASKSPIDILAVGDGKPNLMVQAKRDGKLPFSEWNALWEIAQQFGCWPVLAARPPGENRGFVWFRLTQAKERKGLPQAPFMVPFDPREPEQTSLLTPASAVLAEA